MEAVTCDAAATKQICGLPYVDGIFTNHTVLWAVEEMYSYVIGLHGNRKRRMVWLLLDHCMLAPKKSLHGSCTIFKTLYAHLAQAAGLLIVCLFICVLIPRIKSKRHL